MLAVPPGGRNHHGRPLIQTRGAADENVKKSNCRSSC